MKKIFVVLLICILTQITWAHDAHQQMAFPRKWNMESTHQTIEGTFYLFKNNTVFIEDNEGNIKSISYNNLSLNDQQFVQKRQASINALHAKAKPIINGSSSNQFTIKLYLMVALLIFIAWQFFNADRKKWFYVMPTVLVGGLVMSYSFTSKTLKKSTDITYLKSAFDPFRPNVNTRWDANYFYVESIGIPEHEMMKGITGWQQQFPIPQCYIGTNAWSIPLNPVKASTPVPVNQQHFLRGAIAVAANGIAIFNPYTNTGVDAFLDGQLDEFGGHCGRADDYHYHTAPMFLDTKTSDILPIAFALDGYAVYGALEPDGSAMKTLDANHGHEGANGLYHYHGTATAPYMIGNMVGQVTEDTTLQIIPQASAKPIRPAGTPLKGAVITGCKSNLTNNGYTLTYTLNGKTDSVEYSWTPAGNYTFNFYASGVKTTNTYKGTICTVPNTVGVKQLNFSNKIAIYPNPTNENLYIGLTDIDSKQITNISIFNLSGKQVYGVSQFENTIDIKSFEAGIYFIKIKTNQTEVTKKFVID
jgi:hypothetical protein